MDTNQINVTQVLDAVKKGLDIANQKGSFTLDHASSLNNCMKLLNAYVESSKKYQVENEKMKQLLQENKITFNFNQEKN